MNQNSLYPRNYNKIFYQNEITLCSFLLFIGSIIVTALHWREWNWLLRHKDISYIARTLKRARLYRRCKKIIPLELAGCLTWPWTLQFFRSNSKRCNFLRFHSFCGNDSTHPHARSRTKLTFYSVVLRRTNQKSKLINCIKQFCVEQIFSKQYKKARNSKIDGCE